MSHSRHSVRLAATAWAEARGLTRLEPRAVADEIQLDVLRRDPWGSGGGSRHLAARAVIGLNPALLYALFTGSPEARPSRFFSAAGGELCGNAARLCHFSGFGAPPLWLEWVPFGWLAGVAVGRIELTFWQIALTEQAATRYGGMLSVRDKSDRARSREVVQGRRLATSERLLGHRAVSSESIAFLDRYSLIVGDDADEIAVRDMFGPSYLTFMTEEAMKDLFVELRGRLLSVGVRKLALEDDELDALENVADRTVVALLDGAGYGEEVPPPGQSVSTSPATASE